MQTAYLNEVSEIRTGYSFRKAQSLQEETGLLGLQINDLRHMKVVDPSRLTAIEWPGRGDPPVLKSGEVVIAAKGNENYAAIYLGNERNIIPSSQLLVITVNNPHRVSPQFLCWLLNYPDIQQKLVELQTGSNIYSLSKKALQHLQVPIPTQETQEQLLRLARLYEEEERLTNDLLKNREVMVHALSKKLLYGK